MNILSAENTPAPRRARRALPPLQDRYALLERAHMKASQPPVRAHGQIIDGVQQHPHRVARELLEELIERAIQEPRHPGLRPIRDRSLGARDLGLAGEDRLGDRVADLDLPGAEHPVALGGRLIPPDRADAPAQPPEREREAAHPRHLQEPAPVHLLHDLSLEVRIVGPATRRRGPPLEYDARGGRSSNRLTGQIMPGERAQGSGVQSGRPRRLRSSSSSGL